MCCLIHYHHFMHLQTMLSSFACLFALCFVSFLSLLSFPLSQAKKLESKEKELASISSFYKEQLEILEKKVRTISHLRDPWKIRRQEIARTHLFHLRLFSRDMFPRMVSLVAFIGLHMLRLLCMKL